MPVGAVLTEVFAELATGLPPLFVKGAALFRAEPEAESTGWWCEWVVHGEGPFFRREAPMRFRYVNDISETIVMQRPAHHSASAACRDGHVDGQKLANRVGGGPVVGVDRSRKVLHQRDLTPNSASHPETVVGISLHGTSAVRPRCKR